MLDVDKSIELLTMCSSHLKRAYVALVEDWRPDAPPPTLAMSSMGKALVAAASQMPGEEIASVSECIERLFETGTEEAKDAVATGLLEAVVAAEDLNKPGAAAVRSSLGPRAKEYCEAWDRFAGY